MSFASEPVCTPHCPAVETWFQASESLFEDFHFQAEHRLTEGSGMTAQSAVRNAGRWNHVRFSALSFPAFISGFPKVSLPVFSYRAFSHSAYQQENTWISASTLEFNGLGMNPGTENIETFQVFWCHIGFTWINLHCFIFYIFSLG